MSLRAEAEARGCYCGLWETSPETLEQQGLPRGFCGKCDICGKPGHTRHFPGPVPASGAWCDRHYRLVLWLHPMSWRGRKLWMALLGAALVGYVLYAAR